MCQLGTAGRSQGRAAGNRAVSVPQFPQPGGGVTAPCWVSHCGGLVICTMMGCPGPLPAPPNPAWGYNGAVEGVPTSHPVAGTEIGVTSLICLGVPILVEARPGDLGLQQHPRAGTPRCCSSCRKPAGRGFAGTGWMIPGSVPHPSILCSLRKGTGGCHPDTEGCHRDSGWAVLRDRHRYPRVGGAGTRGGGSGSPTAGPSAQGGPGKGDVPMPVSAAGPG